MDGVYRYDVLVNGETIFIGNVYLEAFKNPTIDVTDIVANYVDVNNPLSFPANVADPSPVLKTIKVVLYLEEDKYSNEGDVLMLYKSPYYDGIQTTPILTTYPIQGIKTMPMLQGWDYQFNKGHFLPTLPVTQTNEITFDMVCGYQALPFIQLVNVEYANGTKAPSKTVSIQGNGVYQYSVAIDQLNTGINNGNEFLNTYDFSKLVKDPTSQIKWEASADGNNLLLTPASNTFQNPTYISKIFLRYENEDGTQFKSYSLNSYSGVENQFTATMGIGYSNFNVKRIKVDIMTKEQLLNTNHSWYGSSLTIELDIDRFKVLMLNGNLVSINTTWDVNITGDGVNGYEGYIKFGATVNTDLEEIGEPCDAKFLKVTTFSPVYSTERYEYTIAKFDNKSRFFLRWKDRYGMPQVQPFAGTDKYSESIESREITDYKNTRRIVGKSIQPKFLLNSGWIEEQYYPYYESIYISPYLQLYDAVYDKLYNVILTNNDYEKKTAKNQNKQLFNIQLEVELDTKQSMIY
jgi:hypothetical protein